MFATALPEGTGHPRWMCSNVRRSRNGSARRGSGHGGSYLHRRRYRSSKLRIAIGGKMSGVWMYQIRTKTGDGSRACKMIGVSVTGTV